MIYEAYEKKVRGYLPAAKIFKICVKCAIVLLILAAVALLGYLSLRGIYFGEYSLKSETVAFGDKPEYDCFVLFGTYRCEYARPGSDSWTDVQPTTPGEYRVRAVITKGFFGKQIYSEEGTVTLYRRNVTLQPSAKFGASVPYGEAPVYGKHWEIPSSVLAKGHSVDAAGALSYEYDGRGGMTLYVDVNSVVIRDRKGNDVTAGYVLQGGGGTVKVKAKQLTVVVANEIKNGKPVNITKTYDGKSISTSSYQITSGSLLEQDRIFVTAVNAPSDVGRHNNNVRVTVQSSAGQDRTSYYDIKLDVCKIVIEPRPLSVTTPDVTLEYSGQTQYTDQYKITSGSIATGQLVKLVYNAKTGVSEVTNRPVENKVQLQILAGDKDVTKNYDITYDFGSLVVKPRVLHLRSRDSQGLVYNGAAQSFSEYRIMSGSLGPGHSVKVKKAASLTVPGSCVNEVEYEIVSANGKNVTKNYDLQVSYGTLTIEKGAVLQLELEPLYKTYDAKPLDPSQYSADVLFNVVGGKLYSNDYIEIVSTQGSRTDAGESTYSVQYRIMHKEGIGAAVDATDWYASSLLGEGTLTVAKRTVIISFDPITCQYSGQAVTAPRPDGYNQLIENYEGKGHVVRFAQDVMSSIVYTKNGQAVSVPVEVGTYTYTIPENKISVVLNDGSGADRTQNYDFRYEGNTIKIEGISLQLTAPSATKQYDATPLSAEQFSLDEVGVKWGAGGYRVSYTLTGSRTDAGTSPVGFTDIVITDSLGRNVTPNFDVKTVPGKLTITPISIKAQSSSGSKVYDGKPLENATQMTLLSGNLVAGHVLGGAVNTDYITDVGTYENDRVTPKVYTATGQDVSRNYLIELKPGKYTVTPADLHIEAPLVEGEYTGEPYVGTCDGTAHAQGLAQGQRVELYVKSSGVELGRHDMQITGCRIVSTRGEDKSANYNVTYTDGELLIVPRKITVVTGSSMVSYENAPAVNTDISVGGSGLLEGHNVRATFTYPEGIFEIGSTSNTLESVWVEDQNGRDVSEYYSISLQSGTLRVRPIEVTLKTGSQYKEVYDGLPIASLEYEVTKGYFLEGHSLHGTLRYADGVSDVGKWKNEFALLRVTDENGRDVSYMYEFTVDAGILEIAKPYELSLKSESAQKVYDGKPLRQGAYELLGELLPGHKIKDVNVVELTLAGSAQNRLTLVILDENGSDVSRNYKFVYEEGMCGELLITPAQLSITIGHVEPYYNGTPSLSIPQDQLEYQGLIPGERIMQIVRVDSPEIGEKTDFELQWPRIYNASGTDVTDCYEITVNADHLSVTVVPAPLTLYLPDRFTKEYDGKGVTVEDAGYRAIGLAQGHSVVYEATETDAHPGLYTLEFLRYTVYDQSGEDVTDNYTVTVHSCTVNIYNKYIKLTSESASRHYNGQPLTCHELKKYTLSGGYTLDVVFTGSQTEVGSSPNTFEVRVFDAEGNDVTDYCNISKSYGTLEVWDQIKLKLSSGSATKIFDGTALVCHELSKYKLPDGYSMEVIFTGERIEPGESENTFEVVIYDAEGNDVTASFAVIKKYGTLKVLERASDYVLTLRSQSAKQTYNGSALICHELEPYELPDGFVLDVVFTGEQTEIGSSANTFTARAYNEAGEELTVVCEYGILEVTLDITVTAFEKTFTYDGTEKNCEDDDFWTQGLPEGFTVDVTFGEGLTVTGSKDVEIESVRVYDANGNDVTDLCNLKINPAKLTVLPRTLTVYVYGQSADSIEPVQGSLVAGHSMFAEYGESGECYIEITDESGALVYSNRGDSPIKYVLYDVIIQYG
ncbi:MAG: hypothetical protein IJW70_11775 [Clostridia bacterium]|nr:hypothetical protein [Clostridia bacterium]MBQ7380342.1 hypothetical protein [Clostridia bacterium]